MCGKRTLIIIAILCLASCLAASSYLGLQPGRSSKKDADQALGAPIREVLQGVRYDYEAEKHGLKKLSVVFNKETGLIESIYLYFEEDYPLSKMKEWFALQTPGKTDVDAEGNLIQSYAAEGISLHFAGPDEGSGVKFLSFFTQPPLQAKQEPTPVVPAPPSLAVPATDRKPRLGVEVIQHEGEGIKIHRVHENSPAQKAGLKPDDLILEMGQYSFYRNNQPIVEFIEAVRMMPINSPVPFLVKRSGQNIAVRISLEEMAPGDVIRAGRELANRYSGEATKLINRRDYPGAVGYLKKAIANFAEEPYFYDSLAYCYIEMGEEDLAIPELKKSLSLGPHYFASYLLGYAYWKQQKFDEAIIPFRDAAGLLPQEKRDPAVYVLLGSCYFRKGMIEEALDVFKKAYGIDNTAPITVYYLAACFDRLGNKKEAVIYYKKYLGLRYKDPQMNRFASDRVKALTSRPPSEAEAKVAESFLKIFDLVIENLAKRKTH